MSLAAIHKTGLYAMVTLVGMVVAVLAAYYVLVEFIYPIKSRDIVPLESFSGITQARGTIVLIELDSQSLSTTTRVTLIDESGEQKRVRIPVHSGADCVIVHSIDPASLLLGDVIDVKGATDNDGDIFPCKESEHHVVKVVSMLPARTEEFTAASSTASTTQENVDFEKVLESNEDS